MIYSSLWNVLFQLWILHSSMRPNLKEPPKSIIFLVLLIPTGYNKTTLPIFIYFRLWTFDDFVSVFTPLPLILFFPTLSISDSLPYNLTLVLRIPSALLFRVAVKYLVSLFESTDLHFDPKNICANKKMTASTGGLGLRSFCIFVSFYSSLFLAVHNAHGQLNDLRRNDVPLNRSTMCQEALKYLKYMLIWDPFVAHYAS